MPPGRARGGAGRPAAGSRRPGGGWRGRDVWRFAGSGSGPVTAPRPVTGLVKQVLVEADGSGPVVALGLPQCEGCRSPLGRRVARRCLVPPEVPELAGAVAECGSHRSAPACDDAPDTVRVHVQRTGGPR